MTRTDEIFGKRNVTKLKWNDQATWVWSDKVVQEPLIDTETFQRAQEVMAARGAGRNTRERTRTTHRYVLRGLLYCNLCGRRMQGQKTKDALYYRCRFATEYALANKIQHPRNVYLAEREVLGPLDDWLATSFAPHRLHDTLDALHAAQPDTATDPAVLAAEQVIADCTDKLGRYRAALEAGADAVLVTQWIAEAQASRSAAHAAVRRAQAQAQTVISRQEISMFVEQLGNVRTVLADADPDDKARVYQQLGLTLTYQPGKRLVRTEMVLDPHGWGLDCVRGASCTLSTRIALSARA